MAPFPDPPATLADARAALRLAAERDIPEILIAHQDDPGLARALWLERPPSGAELGRRCEDAGAHRAAGSAVWLTILASAGTGSDECRGQIDVRDVDPDHRRAELSVWIARGARRRGLASSALSLAGRWLLSDGGLERVAALADPADPAIRGALSGAGFHSEGVLRGYRLARTGRLDVEVFSLVRADLDSSGSGGRSTWTPQVDPPA